MYSRPGYKVYSDAFYVVYQKLLSQMQIINLHEYGSVLFTGCTARVSSGVIEL